jgi:hypothetical protein
MHNGNHVSWFLEAPWGASGRAKRDDLVVLRSEQWKVVRNGDSIVTWHVRRTIGWRQLHVILRHDDDDSYTTRGMLSKLHLTVGKSIEADDPAFKLSRGLALKGRDPPGWLAQRSAMRVTLFPNLGLAQSALLHRPGLSEVS